MQSCWSRRDTIDPKHRLEGSALVGRVREMVLLKGYLKRPGNTITICRPGSRIGMVEPWLCTVPILRPSKMLPMLIFAQMVRPSSQPKSSLRSISMKSVQASFEKPPPRTAAERPSSASIVSKLLNHFCVPWFA